jgi:hypothetical protein
MQKSEKRTEAKDWKVTSLLMTRHYIGSKKKPLLLS